MEEVSIRLLRADEIECRVSVINEKGLSLLLFKDARVDQKILDETFTPFGWKRSHQEIDGNLYCTVEIWDEGKKQWIGKQDVGTVSYSEKEKGQASDSFKRACFNWGIGRELYTAPFIWVPAEQAKIYKKGDRFCTGERFQVESVRYKEEREIAALTILDSKGKRVFSYTGQDREKSYEPAREESPAKALHEELERTGVALQAVLERYHIRSIKEMTPDMYRDALSGLKKSRSKAA